MTLPRRLMPLAAVGALIVLVPFGALATRVEWTQFWPLVTSEAALSSLLLSLRTAVVAALLCLVFGLPLGAALHRAGFRGASVARALVLAPLVLPPVVGGLALLYAFGRRGLLGGTLEAFGIEIAFTTSAVVIAQTFVALPFMVLAVETALSTRPGRHEAIAATLGARPWTVFTRVTLPALVPALLTGTVLAFARAVGEFGATLTFAGSLHGVTRTAPLEIYLAREGDPEAAVALGVLLVAVSIIVVALAYRRTAAR